MPSIYDFDFNEYLQRDPSAQLFGLRELPTTNPVITSPITSIVPSGTISSGDFAGVMNIVDGHLQSKNFVTGSTGWRIDSDGDLEASSGTFRGSLIAGSIHIPDQDTTANSFHVQSDADTWWGCTETNFTADNDNANAYILKTGVAKFQNVTLSSNVTLSGLQSGSEISIQGWQHDMAFSATDHDTVAWASGTITLMDGTTYSIGAGNTGTMSAITYIYLDIATSTTALQTSTTASNAVGSGKILVAVAQNVASGRNATFQVFGGKALGGSGKLVTASDLAANTITANEIASNTITASEIASNTITASEIATNTITASEIATNTITSSELTTGAFVTATANISDGIITNAKISDLAVSKLTAGTITSKAITLAVSAGSGDVKIQAGKTDFGDTTAGFILGMDDSDSDLPKLEIGDANEYFKWTGSGIEGRGYFEWESPTRLYLPLGWEWVEPVASSGTNWWFMESYGCVVKTATGTSANAYADYDYLTFYDRNPKLQFNFEFECDQNSRDLYFTMGYRTGGLQYIGWRWNRAADASYHLYAVYSDAVTPSSNEITGYTITDKHDYKIVMTSGTNIVFYVDGTLERTDTTNLPVGQLDIGGGGFYPFIEITAGLNTNGSNWRGPIYFSIDK